MEKKDNNKVLLLIGIVVSVLIVLVFSATYAYFSVTGNNNFGTTTIEGSAESVGSVTLNGTSANLLMNLSASDMMQDNATTWYASSTNKTETPTEERIGEISVTGNGYFSCTYTLNISHSGTRPKMTLYSCVNTLKICS